MVSSFKKIPAYRRRYARLMGDIRDMLNAAMAERESQTGLTRADVAKEIKVHKSQVSRLLNGTGNMTFESFSKLATALHKKPIIRLRDMDEMIGNHPLADSGSPSHTVSGPGRVAVTTKVRQVVI